MTLNCKVGILHFELTLPSFLDSFPWILLLSFLPWSFLPPLCGLFSSLTFYRGHFFLVDTITVDVFFHSWTFFLWPFLPIATYEEGIR